jgi:hypothetical protein
MTDSLYASNGKNDHNLTHNQSELERENSLKSKSQKSSTTKVSAPSVNPARNTLLDSHLPTQSLTLQSFVDLHFDFLQGRTKLLKPLEIKEFKRFLVKDFQIDLTKANQKRPKWTQSTEFEDGTDNPLTIAEFCYVEPEEDKKISHKEHQLYLRIPGRKLSLLSLEQQYRLCRRLFLDYGFNATRIDIAFDDYSRILDLEELNRACEEGSCSGFDDFFFGGGGKRGEGKTNRTLYLGSKQSNKRLRNYDAMPRHKINAIRTELQLRREKAVTLFEGIVDDAFRPSFARSPFSENEVKTYLAKALFDQFNFCDKLNSKGKVEKNVSRRKLLPRWQAFKEAVLSSCQ